MSIRLMEHDDLLRIVALEKSLFVSAWSYDDFLYELLENPFSYNFVYEKDGQVIGYIGVWIMYEQAQITTVGVDERYQRQGIGHKLMAEAIAFALSQECEVMSLEVRVSNVQAIALYQSLGFEVQTIRKDYYQDNHEDAYLMMKRLEEEK